MLRRSAISYIASDQERWTAALDGLDGFDDDVVWQIRPRASLVLRHIGVTLHFTVLSLTGKHVQRL